MPRGARETRKLAVEIDKKNMQIALHDNDLTESQDLVRQLEYNKTGLQGEIRAKNQEIVRRQLES